MKAAFYTGTRHGWRGIGNWFVRLRTGSRMSHCEIVLDERDGHPATDEGHLCIGSSATDQLPMDTPVRAGKYGGVRAKRIDLTDGQWWTIDIDQSLAPMALARALSCLGMRYDVRGIVGFVLWWTRHREDRIHCSGLLVWCLFGLRMAHMHSPVMAHDITETLGAPQ